MRVAEYFSATLPEWERIYQRKTLYATIYQERLWTALRLVEKLGLPPGSQVLDLGCGPGIGSTILAKSGFSVHAADSAPEMVELTLQRAKTDGVRSNVRGSVTDIHSLSFDEATFDLVFVIGVSEWLESLARPLGEVARVLKPGGRLILSADNAWALPRIFDPLVHPMVEPIKRSCGAALRRLWPKRSTFRTRAYSARALELALRRAGLTKKSGVTLGFGPFSFLNQKVLPERWGHALHHRLTALAEARSSPLRHAGLVHLVIAEKS